MTHGEKKALTTSIDRFCNDAEQTPRAIITSIRFLTPSSLYSVRFLSQHISTFDERLYEFASYFFIMEIFKTTLLPMSIYGFSTTVAGILFSTTVGSIVDTTPRLTGSSHPLDPLCFPSKWFFVCVCVPRAWIFFSFNWMKNWLLC